MTPKSNDIYPMLALDESLDGFMLLGCGGFRCSGNREIRARHQLGEKCSLWACFFWECCCPEQWRPGANFGLSPYSSWKPPQAKIGQGTGLSICNRKNYWIPSHRPDFIVCRQYPLVICFCYL